MKIERDARARLELGLLIRKARTERRIGRGKLAHMVGVERRVIAKMEHGVANPTRAQFVRAINILKLPDEEKNQAYSLLRIFAPRRQSNVKFHLPISILERRRAIRRRLFFPKKF